MHTALSFSRLAGCSTQDSAVHVGVLSLSALQQVHLIMALRR